MIQLWLWGKFFATREFPNFPTLQTPGGSRQLKFCRVTFSLGISRVRSLSAKANFGCDMLSRFPRKGRRFTKFHQHQWSWSFFGCPPSSDLEMKVPPASGHNVFLSFGAKTSRIRWCGVTCVATVDGVLLCVLTPNVEFCVTTQNETRALEKCWVWHVLN